jgi:hypothetical protein
MLELIESLATSYKLANNELKTVILKNLMLELFVNSKKELSYADNSLFFTLKSVQNMQKNSLEVPHIAVSELYNNIFKFDLDDLKSFLRIIKQ